MRMFLTNDLKKSDMHGPYALWLVSKNGFKNFKLDETGEWYIDNNSGVTWELLDEEENPVLFNTLKPDIRRLNLKPGEIVEVNMRLHCISLKRKGKV